MPISTVKGMFDQAKVFHLLVCDFNASGISTCIESRGNRQPSACGRIRYEIHNHAIAA